MYEMTVRDLSSELGKFDDNAPVRVTVGVDRDKILNILDKWDTEDVDEITDLILGETRNLVVYGVSHIPPGKSLQRRTVVIKAGER